MRAELRLMSAGKFRVGAGVRRTPLMGNHDAGSPELWEGRVGLADSLSR